ncbi:MAG: DNA replication/repair protein RecF [Candidatus Obscuribacterales bacterium]|nr:DNA replication/repair protein RecF [Candidatus Obscuribacterales bacterium]
MYVKSLKLKNYRNYKSGFLEFQQGKNIIIGENAQGKTNLLEAVEVLSTGKAARAADDKELVLWGENSASLDLLFENKGYEESLSFEWLLKEPARPGMSGRCQKSIKVNGVKQESIKSLLGRLITVSFSSNDMKILRDGPKYRRDWLDSMAMRLKPSFHDTVSNYNRSLLQRNKLLKTLSEKARLTVQDQDELYVWDKQLAKFGTLIIKRRLQLLSELLPIAERFQSALSRESEKLEIDYAFRAREETSEQSQDDIAEEGENSDSTLRSLDEIKAMEDLELAKMLLKLMKERRWLELRRKQSLVGPHRDNLIFKLNGAAADHFASQGQQRSIVLALKLAELKRVENEIGESPVLLLDDVLSELDEKRAALLLSCVSDKMQTIMSTTHLTAIEESWLDKARIMSVQQGRTSLHLNQV